ncbi:YdeI/OmpD-associated family protein [Blastococcus sp. SYSU D00695]
MSEPRSVTFETTVTAVGTNTGIAVPDELVTELGAGRRPPVLVDLDGHRYRTTVGVMGGTAMVSVSAAVRKATGLTGGAPVRVTLTVADTPREVVVPEDLAAALAADPTAGTFFAGLSNSLQRYHCDNVAGAKTPETRQRRVEKAIALFREGRQR